MLVSVGPWSGLCAVSRALEHLLQLMLAADVHNNKLRCMHHLETLQVLVANTPMDTDKIKMYGARVKTDSLAKVADIETAERAKMKTKCEQIIAQGINVFINRQLIYNYPEQIFTDAGVMSIEHAGAPPCPAIPAELFWHPTSSPKKILNTYISGYLAVHRTGALPSL